MTDASLHHRALVMGFQMGAAPMAAPLGAPLGCFCPSVPGLSGDLPPDDFLCRVSESLSMHVLHDNSVWQTTCPSWQPSGQMGSLRQTQGLL